MGIDDRPPISVITHVLAKQDGRLCVRGIQGKKARRWVCPPRAGDMHVRPAFDGPVPHVGGPILPPGCPTVLIGGMPAARVGDMATCVGPPDTIALGSFTTLIGSQPAARLGDLCGHGGKITLGCPTVLIG